MHVRPAMVGFFLPAARLLAFWSVSSSPAAPADIEGDRKQLIVVCCLLGCWPAYSLAWNRNYFILLFIGVFSAALDRPPTRRCLPRAGACRQDRPRSGDVSAPFLRAGLLAWVIGPPLAYALAMGFGFTAMLSQRRGGVYRLRDHGLAILAQHAQAKPVATGRLEAPRTHRPRCVAAVQHQP